MTRSKPSGLSVVTARRKSTATPTVSPELDRALNALHGHLRDTDNPVGAARVVRRVAAHWPLEHKTQRNAFRREAERMLVPFFGYDQSVAKAVVWLALDAAWEALRGN